jgi:hypothetical protein
MRIRWRGCPQEGHLEGMSNRLVIYLQMASIRRMEPGKEEAAAESFLGKGLECTRLLVLVLLAKKKKEAPNHNTISSFNVEQTCT